MEFEGFSRTSPKIQGFFKTVRALYYCDFEFIGSTLQYLNKWVTGHNELLLIYIQSNLSFGHLYNTDPSIMDSSFGPRNAKNQCQKSYIPYLYNMDTSVKRTLGSVPLVSVLKRFDCTLFTGKH